MTESTRSILNVDDYGPGRYARTRLLRHAGFSVLEAATGAETLQVVAEHHPALILLDVNLPDMSGFEVCRRIRSTPQEASTIIVHISASSVQNAHQVLGLEAGADSYLIEPVDPAVLVATVNAFLRARRAEDALRRSNDELQWFAHRVAHDFSEPLRTITAHSQLLEKRLEGRLQANEARSLKFVLDAGLRMDALINSLLKYAVAGQAITPRETIDSKVMLDRALENLSVAIQGAQARITHGPLPPITADADLEAVFQNLISNGIKYSRANVPPEINVAAEAADDKWHFSIKDNGAGIAPEDRQSIFKIFQRLHSHSAPGTGIGLALVQKIIRAWGGTIWVESEVGVGSTFHFTVPR